MELNKIKDLLGAIAMAGLNGDQIRIALYIASRKHCRLIEIEEALNLRKSTVSRYFKQLHGANILKRYSETLIHKNKKIVIPYYSFNWDYETTEVQVI